MICSLKNLLMHEGNLAVVGILDAIADVFEEDINRLCVVDCWFIHLALVCFEISCIQAHLATFGYAPV